MEPLGKTNLPDKFDQYNDEFLNKRNRALFITIPQTTIGS
jgi:hypothetical protein